MENNTLQQIAQSAKEAHEQGADINNPTELTSIPTAIPIEAVVPDVVNVVEPITADDDDECVIILPPDQTACDSIETNISAANGDGTCVVNMEDARKLMSAIPDDKFDVAYDQMNSDIYNYKKDLMIKQGFTSAEADQAASNRFNRNADAANTKFITDNPKLGVVEINKKDEDNMEFSQEEREKLHKVNSIKLVVVENRDLETLTIKKDFKEEYIAKYIREIDGALCNYSLPLPMLGDFVTFNGAQTLQLVSIVSHEDDEIVEVLERKATLIYDRISYGTILQKYDGKDNVKMSYNDFINSFMYQDLDLALYAIIVASSMEYSETELRCTAESCGATFKQQYNMKKLLQPDMLDFFKDRFEEILNNRNSEEVMKKLHEQTSNITRVKSDFTGNVYDMEFPTIGKAIELYRSVNTSDPLAVYNSTIGLFINKVFIYDATDESYVPISGMKILSVFRTIPQIDIELLSSYIEKHMQFVPKFKLASKCTTCGKEMVNELSIEQMVFLRAQDSSTQIG